MSRASSDDTTVKLRPCAGPVGTVNINKGLILIVVVVVVSGGGGGKLYVN
jgi:hypothetical protein